MNTTYASFSVRFILCERYNFAPLNWEMYTPAQFLLNREPTAYSIRPANALSLYRTSLYIAYETAPFLTSAVWRFAHGVINRLEAVAARETPICCRNTGLDAKVVRTAGPTNGRAWEMYYGSVFTALGKVGELFGLSWYNGSRATGRVFAYLRFLGIRDFAHNQAE